MPLEQAYLTFEEYSEFTVSPTPIIEQATFERLEKASEDAVDLLTNSFYRFNLIVDDVPFRQRILKRAITNLIDFYNVQGGTTSYQLSNSNASSISIGRTSITSNSSTSQNSNLYNGVAVPREVINLLSQGGFLYRGVNTTCL